MCLGFPVRLSSDHQRSPGHYYGLSYLQEHLACYTALEGLLVWGHVFCLSLFLKLMGMGSWKSIPSPCSEDPALCCFPCMLSQPCGTQPAQWEPCCLLKVLCEALYCFTFSSRSQSTLSQTRKRLLAVFRELLWCVISALKCVGSARAWLLLFIAANANRCISQRPLHALWLSNRIFGWGWSYLTDSILFPQLHSHIQSCSILVFSQVKTENLTTNFPLHCTQPGPGKFSAKKHSCPAVYSSWDVTNLH